MLRHGLSGWVQQCPDMARDHQILVGRDHPGRNPAIGLCDARTAGRIGVVVERDAEPGGVPADPATDLGSVFADARGEDQRVKAAERGSQGA